jgi:hypothetical protein
MVWGFFNPQVRKNVRKKEKERKREEIEKREKN